MNDRISIPRFNRCPFCGRDTGQLIIGRVFWMECNNCGFQTEIQSTAEEAVNSWNNKKPYANTRHRIFKEEHK